MATSTTPRWSELSEELLHRIFISLQFSGDRARFGLVCRSWQSVRNHYPPPPIMLNVVGDRTVLDFFYSGLDSDNRRTMRSLPNKTAVILPTKLRLRFRTRGHQQVWGYPRSSWLILSDCEGTSVRLVNPLSDIWISLPPFTLADSSVRFAALSNSSPDSTDCIVVVFYVVNATRSSACKYIRRSSSTDRLAWCKPGDGNWKDLDSLSCQAQSMTFHGGKLYVLLDDCSTCVYEIDGLHPRGGYADGTVTRPDPLQQHMPLKLTECRGELMLLTKVLDRCFRVFKLENMWWVRTRDLGDRALLYSSKGLDSISTKEVPGLGFRSNCIYDFTFMCRYLRVYSLEEEKVCYEGKFLTHDIHLPDTARIRSSTTSSAWFLPLRW